MQIILNFCQLPGARDIKKNGVEFDSEKVRAVNRLKETSSLKDVRSFLGLVGYFQKIIPGVRKTGELYNRIPN